jgi:hypothetical protein
MKKSHGLLLTLTLLAHGAFAANEYTGLSSIPPVDEYCLAAQRVIVRTNIPMELVVHEDFNGFVKSKAIIDGPNGLPEIQQYNWRDDDGNVLGISCKLKNTDHLTLTYGLEAAGPEQPCQEMNRQVHGLLGVELGQEAFSTYKAVIFDPNESPGNPANPGMTGPEWLKPYVMAYASARNGNKELHIASKGFVVEFSDPQFAQAPERFRGVHYCHFIAPDEFGRLLTGATSPPVKIGRDPLAKDLANNPGPGSR